ncbi:MAG: beta-ketoacyl synthase N-terminal-like domain-containing protein, partial [Chloroflexota bacterium]
LDDIDMFDAGFFNIKPVEARVLDPQQRIWFETAWETLENAGYAPSKVDGPIGVFAGSFMNSYVFYNLLPDRETIEGFVRLQAPDAFMHMINNERDYMPTRTSHLLDLKGPAINVQTACSTSLVAVSLASQSILSGESEMALAGGVTVFLPQERGYFYQEGGMRSSDGHCRPFDAKASGTVFASGIGCVLLKRLDKAIEDGDNVLAVVKGTALNNDGSLKASYTAPSIDGQADVISAAQAIAGVEADSISYVEAHGTATPIGDPIEIAALSKAFRRQTDRKQYVALGAVKSGIGHLDAAAGVAGLIKTILSLQNEAIPPTLHYETPNPEIDFENSPFYVVDKLTPWPKGESPRRAGLSSFGVGGTNAHAIVEEAPDLKETGPSRPRQLLVLSAKTESALVKQIENLANHLEAKRPDLADVAYTLIMGRADFPYRRIYSVADIDDAIAQLRDKNGGVASHTKTAEPELVMMFPGQGSQFVGMGRELYESEPIYTEIIDTCAETLEPILELDMRTVLYPADEDDEDAAHKLTQTGLAQPAIFMVSYATAKVWESWGIAPQILVGHSVGEFVAATLAGVFALEDALRIIALRARLMQSLPGGAMRAVRLSAAELEPYLGQGVTLAAANAPSVSIVSGNYEAIAAFEKRLEADEHETIVLHTSHAFHSDMMEPILDPFRAAVEAAERNKPQLPIVSTLTGTWLSEQDAVDPMYWAKQLRNAVRFSDAILTLQETPGRVYLEVGPGKSLSLSTMQHPNKENRLAVVDSLGHPKKRLPTLQPMLETLGRLWQAGVEIDWAQYYDRESRRRVPLPTYPFERQRFWIDPPPLLTGGEPDATASLFSSTPERQPDPVPQQPMRPVMNWQQPATSNISTNQPYAMPMPVAQPASADIPVSQQTIQPQTNPKDATMSRKENISQALTTLFKDLSGIEISPADRNTTFLELGLDSLILTQVSTALKKKMKVNIRFRKLLEDVATLEQLIAYCEEQLPAEAYAAAPAAANNQQSIINNQQSTVGSYSTPAVPNQMTSVQPEAG